MNTRKVKLKVVGKTGHVAKIDNRKRKFEENILIISNEDSKVHPAIIKSSIAPTKNNNNTHVDKEKTTE